MSENNVIEPIAMEPEDGPGSVFQCEVEFITNDKVVIYWDTFSIDDTYNGFPDWLLTKSFIQNDKRYSNWRSYVGKDSLAHPISEAEGTYLRDLLWYNSNKKVYVVSLICEEPKTSPVLTYEGIKILWSQLSLDDYPNNETLIAVLNAIDETKADKNQVVNKQNKHIIVTKDSDGKATLSCTEILAHIKEGTSVYFAENLNSGTVHSYLEGSANVSCFYSCFFNQTKMIATYYEIDKDKNITKIIWTPNHLSDTTIHITEEERELWNSMPSTELITVEDIDAICGSNIYNASEVKF